MSAYQPTKKEFLSILDSIDKDRYWELTLSRCGHGYELSHFKIELESPAMAYRDQQEHLIYKGSTRKPLNSFLSKYENWAKEYFSSLGFQFGEPESIEVYWIVTTLSIKGMSTEIEKKLLHKKNDQYTYANSNYLFDMKKLNEVGTSDNRNTHWFKCFSLTPNVDLTESAAYSKAIELKEYFEKYLKNLPVLATA